MNLVLMQPSCPACGRSVAAALRWARVMETSDVLVLDLDTAGTMKNTLNIPTVDLQCGSCGSPIRIAQDAPLAAA